MNIYRNTMEKVLDQQDRDTPVTNPKEPYRTFFRKWVYRFSVWRAKRKGNTIEGPKKSD